MTDKEKAIKALNAIKYFEESWYSDLFPIIEKQLNQPTLDDAIAVVESIKKSLPTLTSREIINVYKRVLTALKGLKEGKRE